MTTQTYLSYKAGPVFNVIGSSAVSLCSGGLVATGAAEDVLVWDVRRGEKVVAFASNRPNNGQVTTLCESPQAGSTVMAVGYANGSVIVFNGSTAAAVSEFNGHSTAVTCLAYNANGTQLVSGSRDTDIVLWDTVNEAGLYRLRGHKGEVTKCLFLKHRHFLASSSKDGFVKFWDLDTQHCFYTLVGHHTEIWDMVLLHRETCLVTGGIKGCINLWNVTYKDGFEEMVKDGEEETDSASPLTCEAIDAVGKSKGHGGCLVKLKADPTEKFLCCQRTDTTLDIFNIFSEEQTKKNIAKRQKVAGDDCGQTRATDDHIRKMATIKASSKVKSFDIALDNQNLEIVVLLRNNCVESYRLDKTMQATTLTNKLCMPGHRSDVRTVSFSSDNLAVLSVSKESLKVWNRPTQYCISTIDCLNGRCSTFIAGDRHCLVGCTDGKIKIFDLAAGVLLEDVDAHDGIVWSICLAPDGRGFASGSADKTVKFWEFEMIRDEKVSKTRPTIIHTRTLKLSEDVLSIKFSPDYRLLAVALLDSTVKLFFVDTLKLFQNLYGHKLPVTCMDITHDNSIIITGSSDRNVKIWGLDFGDCHKSLFAHDDNITCIQFVPKTHLFFTSGRDNMIKQWDADSFKKILTLRGHLGAVWAMAISPSGKHIVSAGMDKAIRLWEQTLEPLVLGEEEELAREEEYDKQEAAETGEAVIPGETNRETGLPGKTNVETLKAADRLIEALDIYQEEQEKFQQLIQLRKDNAAHVQTYQPHLLFKAYSCETPAHFMLYTLKQIKSSELEEALLLLPFNYMTELVKVLAVVVEKGWEVELTGRILCFMLRIHHGQITSNTSLLPTIQGLRQGFIEMVQERRDLFNFNMAGLHFLKKEMEAKEQIVMFEDASRQVAEKAKKKKKRHAALKRAILTL